MRSEGALPGWGWRAGVSTRVSPERAALTLAVNTVMKQLKREEVANGDYEGRER